jgi:Fe2+ or Zn2+ uptake regulation protein
MALTDQQAAVLKALDDSEGPLTTHEVGEVIRRQFRDSPHGYYDRARSVLARLEKRGLVQRQKTAGRVSAWQPTRAGLDALPG